MKLAKEKLPRVDAIGGSATGTISPANEATWCDIFPNVPHDVYKAKVINIFPRLAKDLAGDVPLKVINDGEVAALAAAHKIGQGNVMGISMGSSEGAGYVNADGHLLNWINELCYVRLDLNPRAPSDPWSRGQQCMRQGKHWSSSIHFLVLAQEKENTFAPADKPNNAFKLHSTNSPQPSCSLSGFSFFKTVWVLPNTVIVHSASDDRVFKVPETYGPNVFCTNYFYFN